jgi:hypothetical protein
VALLGRRGKFGNEKEMNRIWLIWFCVFSMPAQADALGRLFYSPAQREMLDLARKTTPLNTNSSEAEPNVAQGFIVNGVVTRSDGQRSTWVNGHLEQSVDHSGKHGRNQAHVQLPGGEIKLKVGQSYNPTTGRVEENYRRAPPAAAQPEPSVAKPTPPKATTKTPALDGRDDNAEPETAPQ